MTHQPQYEPSADLWLTLTDYSSKYRVSVSTLRRRIRANQIEHKFDAGKYLIKDSAPLVHEPETPTYNYQPADATTAYYAQAAQNVSLAGEPVMENLEKAAGESQEPILSTATKLLNELKKAYMSILQEKEEQIVQLKEEVTDLKTLVRVLEQENDRLRFAHLRDHQ